MASTHLKLVLKTFNIVPANDLIFVLLCSYGSTSRISRSSIKSRFKA